MAADYDDQLWELVPENPGAPPEHVARFVRELGPVVRALDYGCGDGRLTLELEAADLTVADVSLVALKRARTRLSSATLVLLEPGTQLPFDDSAFDLVLCAETIEHVQDTQRLLSEFRRVLAPGGTLAITTPAHGRRTGLRVLLRGIERSFDPMSPHLRFYSRASLVHALDVMGFEPRRVRTVDGTLLALAER